MQTVLSAAVSVDGYLDDASPERLLLSGGADFDRVDELRAGCDAILVGAGTVRRDDPRLRVRSADRRAARVARGLPEQPLRAVLSRTGSLPADARVGDALVYGDLPAALADLRGRGVRRLLVEGGASVLTQFLTAGLADELQLAVAPFFVGDPAAPRFAGPGSYPHGPANRMQLLEARSVGDMALLRYRL